MTDSTSNSKQERSLSEIAMADLLGLQSDIKRDADGYADDFRLQYRHYQAVLSVFSLHPAQKHEGILELVHFIAQVRSFSPR